MMASSRLTVGARRAQSTAVHAALTMQVAAVGKLQRAWVARHYLQNLDRTSVVFALAFLIMLAAVIQTGS